MARRVQCDGMLVILCRDFPKTAMVLSADSSNARSTRHGLPQTNFRAGEPHSSCPFDEVNNSRYSQFVHVQKLRKPNTKHGGVAASTSNTSARPPPKPASRLQAGSHRSASSQNGGGGGGGDDSAAFSEARSEAGSERNASWRQEDESWRQEDESWQQKDEPWQQEDDPWRQEDDCYGSGSTATIPQLKDSGHSAGTSRATTTESGSASVGRSSSGLSACWSPALGGGASRSVRQTASRGSDASFGLDVSGMPAVARIPIGSRPSSAGRSRAGTADSVALSAHGSAGGAARSSLASAGGRSTAAGSSRGGTADSNVASFDGGPRSGTAAGGDTQVAGDAACSLESLRQVPNDAEAAEGAVSAAERTLSLACWNEAGAAAVAEAKQAAAEAEAEAEAAASADVEAAAAEAEAEAAAEAAGMPCLQQSEAGSAHDDDLLMEAEDGHLAKLDADSALSVSLQIAAAAEAAGAEQLPGASRLSVTGGRLTSDGQASDSEDEAPAGMKQPMRVNGGSADGSVGAAAHWPAEVASTAEASASAAPAGMGSTIPDGEVNQYEESDVEVSDGEESLAVGLDEADRIMLAAAAVAAEEAIPGSLRLSVTGSRLSADGVGGGLPDVGVQSINCR